MPDDDRYTRDRVRTLDLLSDRIRKRAREGRAPDTTPEQLALPVDEVLPSAAKALEQIMAKIGTPDLEEAAERTRALAETLKEEGPGALDLCAGHRSSGMQALIDQAVSTVLAGEDPGSLLRCDPGTLAVRIGEEFALGAIRRYSLDRFAPFVEGDASDIGDALDFLELADLTLTSTILRELIKDLLT